MKKDYNLEFQTVGGDLFTLDFRNIIKYDINIIGGNLDSLSPETPLELYMEIKPRGSLCVVVSISTLRYIDRKYSEYFNNNKVEDSDISEEDSTDILTVVYNYRQEILKLKAIIQDLKESSILNSFKNIFKTKENK